MQRKIFIGIELSPSVKKRLDRRISEWKDLPVKWVRPENFHITLLYLGYVHDDAVPEICEAATRSAQSVDSFDIALEEIVLAPEGENPKMIWVDGPASQELKSLRENLEKALGVFVAEKKEFHPHVMLGRIRKHKWEALDGKPSIKENFSVGVAVNQIVVFESKSVRGKRVHEPVETCELG